MNRGTLLALVAAPTFDAAAQEFLRLCVGLRVGGHDVRLVELGPGRGLLSANAELPDEAERFLAALAEEGVQPQVGSAAEVRAALRACGRVMRIGPAGRTGEPAVLAVDAAWLDAVGDDALIRTLVEAGQVIRV